MILMLSSIPGCFMALLLLNATSLCTLIAALLTAAAFRLHHALLLVLHHITQKCKQRCAPPRCSP
jgi:hypothetical protein